MSGGAWALRALWVTLSKLHPLASVPPRYHGGLGPARLDRLRCPVPGSQESPRHVQGPGRRLLRPAGTALGRVPLGRQAGLLPLWPPGPGPGGLGPVLNITHSLKALWKGVLADSGMRPLPSPLGQPPAACGRLETPSPTQAWCGIQQPLRPGAALHRPSRGSRTLVGPVPHTCVITRVPCQAQTHRPQLQWQTRSSPRRCGRM